MKFKINSFKQILKNIIFCKANFHILSFFVVMYAFTFYELFLIVGVGFITLYFLACFIASQLYPEIFLLYNETSKIYQNKNNIEVREDDKI